ncbi:hypothetical protein A2837_02475 [Candidatus Kaiserbacteria bacterium RIFCSPHIGHO2_01_FULL_46_22]|uniref:DUF305 domain-containing protein n=1 Tax=Candidatus Kaiserbacteria bacterium RIFCSPHIGHO2_01_FULL_46_22 TaxID=1798475 RepID=A0A1F6BWQ4_9BACT|nr:MAG: hypothetical protein A2837_02475 [Candidatus Kaiserbacteria bacterium RIFCSPHIGHO2_01_FULL_46_22]
MDTKIILVALAALVIGAGGGYAVASNKETPEAGEHMMGGGQMMRNESDEMNVSMNRNMGGAMDGMMRGLEGKTGDEFDQAFLAEMVMHHEGAVEMAKAALENGKHEEIKTMANAIISAQTTEIKQMQDWQKSWYGN